MSQQAPVSTTEYHSCTSDRLDFTALPIHSTKTKHVVEDNSCDFLARQTVDKEYYYTHVFFLIDTTILMLIQQRTKLFVKSPVTRHPLPVFSVGTEAGINLAVFFLARCLAFRYFSYSRPGWTESDDQWCDGLMGPDGNRSCQLFSPFQNITQDRQQYFKTKKVDDFTYQNITYITYLIFIGR